MLEPCGPLERHPVLDTLKAIQERRDRNSNGLLAPDGLLDVEVVCRRSHLQPTADAAVVANLCTPQFRSVSQEHLLG